MSKRNIINNVYLLHSYNQYYETMKRSILMSGQCTTRKATQEELDEFKK